MKKTAKNTKKHLFEMMDKLNQKHSLNENNAPFYPQSLIQRAIALGFITKEEYYQNKQRFDDAAEETAYDYSDWGEDEGFGSSDMTAAIKTFLDYLGIETDFVNGKLTKLEEEDKWQQDAVKKPGALHKELGIPEDEKIPMSLINKKLADLKEKAKGDKKLSDKELKMLQRLNLGKTFKKQAQNEEDVPGMDNYIERSGLSDAQIKQKVDQMKATIDQLAAEHDYESLDALIALILGKKHRFGAQNIGEDHSLEHKRKVDLMKGKLDFYFDNDHYDIIDKLDQIFNKIYTDKVPETEPELAEWKKK